jgi:nitrilase
MPLLRQSLYNQNVNLYLAPTADGRDTWLPLLRTIACEGRCVVLSANQCLTRLNLPSWLTQHELGGQNGSESVNGSSIPTSSRLRRKSTITEDGNEIALPEKMEPTSTFHPEFEAVHTKPQPDDFISHGGSCIVSPLGEVISGPLWDVEDGLLTVNVDFDDCLRGRLDLDVGGSYSRCVSL